MPQRKIYWIKIAERTMLAVGMVAHCLFAQTDTRDPVKDGASNIVTETFAFKSDSSGRGRIDIYIQVPYPEINFVKDGEQYVGRYDVSATVVTQENQELWQKNQVVEVRLKDFAQTVSNKLYGLKRFSVDLLPRTYKLLLQVTDLESKKTTTFSKPLVVKDYGIDSLALSDVMLVSKMDIYNTRKNIVPNLTGVFTKNELNNFYLFFEVYCRTHFDSVQLSWKIMNAKREVVAQRTKVEILSGDRTQLIWHIDTPSVAVDQYKIHVEVRKGFKDTSVSYFHSSASHSFLVRMMDIPFTVTDIDKATDQLQYIATGSEMSKIRDATTPEEKQKRFLEFWAKRDPDPQTVRNELMEEYYARVFYANKNFSHFIEGWKTDRGMVFIRFGAPQNIDRHPFDLDNKPYEIWYYYDQNREFVFVDDTGFGDYRLRYPTTDLWGRVR
jgi:GWxTD domain-containing protein